MATITDNDLKMFQERARTEFASRCDTGGIAWDSVIWDLCNEVRRLRSAPNERADCAKLREALELARLYISLGPEAESRAHVRNGQVEMLHAVDVLDKVSAALAAPPRKSSPPAAGKLTKGKPGGQ